MQKRNPLHPFGLAAGLRRRTRRLLPAGLVAVGLWRATITTGTTVSARAFRAGGGFIVPARMHAWPGPCAAMLRRRRCGFAMARSAVIFPRKSDADQLFDVAQIAHFLGAGDQRDGNALGAGARGAADAVDIGLGNVR